MNICSSHYDPDPAFQPIAKAHVLLYNTFGVDVPLNFDIIIIYVYVILSFISAALPRSQCCCYMPYRHGKEKQWEQCCFDMGFSCVKYDLLSHNMFLKVK